MSASEARCGAATTSGRPCRNVVGAPGERCRLHVGQAAVDVEGPAKATKRPPAKRTTKTAPPTKTAPSAKAPPPAKVAPPAKKAAPKPAPKPADVETIDLQQFDEPPAAPLKVTEPPRVEEPPQEIPQPPPPPDPRQVRAAARCLDLIESGALDDIDKLATPYLGEAGWAQLRASWRVENCKVITPVAREALKSPARLHDAAGQLAGQVWSWLGRPWIEQMMVREVVKRLPVLGEGQVKPIARAAQLATIRLCYEHKGDLLACPCFLDLVEEEGERRPRQLLEAARKGWDGLAKLR